MRKQNKRQTRTTSNLSVVWNGNERSRVMRLIDADLITDVLKKELARDDCRGFWNSTVRSMIEMIEAAPTARLEIEDEEEGEWVNEKGIPVPDQHAVYCSRCQSWSEYRDNYCGNCGARMK